jgi:hypothetical protein
VSAIPLSVYVEVPPVGDGDGAVYSNDEFL